MITGQRVAYQRVSSLDQRVDRQLDGITVERTFTDTVSDTNNHRPQLEAMLSFVRDGDTVIVRGCRRPNCRPASTATAAQARRHDRLSLNGSEESMFGKGKSPELEQILDSLGRSYMRGSVHGTPEARAGLVSAMSAYAQRLRQEGNGKAIEKARSYRPAFFMGLPRDAQTDFQRHVTSAFG